MFLLFYGTIVTNVEKFRALGISEKTLTALAQKWFEEPSKIQELTIPLLLQWNVNIIGQAQTGTGKTAAFGIPLAEKITEHTGYTQAIVMAPTRELAIQVAEEIRSFLSQKKITVATIYGGQSYDIQLRQLKKWADIVVGTPGRVIDHLHRKTLSLDKISYCILDEADEMLNMWFIDDIKEILTHTNADKSMLLFSATMPKQILAVAKKYMGDYKVVSVAQTQMTVTQTSQIYLEVHERDKFEALSRIIDVEPNFFGIIFCKTKLDVEHVASHLSQRWYDAEALHGDIQQRQRERILERFKKRKLMALVATDVAARGIDVDDITHVINYALPGDAESYVHRVGRTGRAGKKWTAITFVTPSEYRKIMYFKKVTKTDITQGKIPSAEDVISIKKKNISTDIHTTIDTKKHEDHLAFAKELLADIAPEDLVASLLTLRYQNELSPERYTPLAEVSVDKTGTARLFIALGKNHGYTSKKLVDYIVDTASISAQDIDDLRVLEDFSFMTVPFAEAEMILHVFDSLRKRGEKPLITKAKEKSSGDRRERSFSDRPRTSGRERQYTKPASRDPKSSSSSSSWRGAKYTPRRREHTGR